jgi:hypothetical protein
MADAFHENIRCGLVALTHRNIQNQFTVTLDCNKDVAVTEVLIVFGANALLFLTAVRPELVKLQIAYRNVADFFGHDALTFLACEYEQFQNRGVMHAGYALDARNRITFEQHRENQLGFLGRDVHAVQVILARLLEELRALAALIPLVTLAVASLALTFGTAIVAGHGISS